MSATILCFNAQREQVDGGDALAAVTNAKIVLEYARTCAARVLHVLTPRRRAVARGVICGLEPLRDEEVVAIRRIAAFDDPTLAPLRTVHLFGGVFSRSGLATTLGALERGVRLTLIADACWAPEEDPIEAREILSLAQHDGAGELSLTRTATVVGEEVENVVDLGAWLR